MPRPTTLPEPWLSLAKKLGGVGALAVALGTTPRTINQWAHGTRTPRGTARVAILAIFVNNKLAPPTWEP